MRRLFFALILMISINQIALSQHSVNLPLSHGESLKAQLNPFFTPAKGQIEDLLKGDVISVGLVDSPAPSQQQMMLFISGIHPRNCTRAMRKLSLYEDYHHFMDFIKESKYEESSQNFSFVINHALMPFPMIVRFKIPRIKGPGTYPFTFEDGFLKDLKGIIIVKEIGKFCSLSLKADWLGPKSKIPDIVFATFIQTVGRIGLEHLIRVSIF
jgi:hypothetical protein